MVDLFKDRIEFVFFFIYSAVDYFGFFYIKDGRKDVKRYGVIFICMFLRVVYIEISNTLEIDFYINVFRRFLVERGSVR